jgi:hypothetical protein
MGFLARSRGVALALAAAAGLLGAAPAALAGPVPPPPEPITDYQAQGPIFGANRGLDGTVVIADSGAGVVEIAADGTATLVAELPGVQDVIRRPGRGYWAVTGEADPPEDGSKLYRVSRDGDVELVADLGAYERANNTDGGLDFGGEPEVNSNPFDLARRGSEVYVADAGANAVLRVTFDGDISVVAVLPPKLVSTDYIKDLARCDTTEPLDEEICGLPPEFPAQSVPTSVSLGRDNRLYVGELAGFPAPPESAQVWRIPRNGDALDCATSPKCKVAADGFTSLIDVNFARGRMIVTELDEATFLALEVPDLVPAGGTVNSCNLNTGRCRELFTGVPIPTTTFGWRGDLLGTQLALDPASATVVNYTG